MSVKLGKWMVRLGRIEMIVFELCVWGWRYGFVYVDRLVEVHGALIIAWRPISEIHTYVETSCEMHMDAILKTCLLSSAALLFIWDKQRQITSPNSALLCYRQCYSTWPYFRLLYRRVCSYTILYGIFQLPALIGYQSLICFAIQQSYPRTEHLNEWTAAYRSCELVELSFCKSLCL